MHFLSSNDIFLAFSHMINLLLTFTYDDTFPKLNTRHSSSVVFLPHKPVTEGFFMYEADIAFRETGKTYRVLWGTLW